MRQGAIGISSSCTYFSSNWVGLIQHVQCSALLSLRAARGALSLTGAKWRPLGSVADAAAHGHVIAVRRSLSSRSLQLRCQCYLPGSSLLLRRSLRLRQDMASRFATQSPARIRVGRHLVLAVAACPWSPHATARAALPASSAALRMDGVGGLILSMPPHRR